MERLTIRDIVGRKGKEPIVVLTAYTAPVAKILDPHVDVLLVGDSLGMVIYGMDSTLPVTLDLMLAHGAAVVRSSKKALVVVDMPFGYQASAISAFNGASLLLQRTGCGAVKIEGGTPMADTIYYLTRRGIPVMGHVGLMPQHVRSMGGYRWQGRNAREREVIIEDALAIQDAGAFAVVLEGIREDIAVEITQKLHIPTIGIGASPQCDGQVLVVDDMAGMFEHTPRFVKRYGNMGKSLEKAVKQYAKDVRTRHFPTLEHCYKPVVK